MQQEAGGFTVSGLNWRLDPQAGDSEVGRMLQEGRDPREARHSMVKANPHRSVMRIELNGSVFYLKQHVCATRADRLRALFLTSRARAEWDMLRRMRAMGFETAQRVAYADGDGADGRTSLIVTRALEGARSLTETAGTLPPERRAGLLKGLGAQIRILHDRGIHHRDMQPGNFFVEAVGSGFKFYFLDLHRARFTVSVPERRRVNDLGQLVFNLDTFCSRAEADALLLGYCGMGPDPRFAMLVRRRAGKLAGVRKRSRSKRCLRNSTHFAVERRGGLRIYRRREIPVETILEAVGGGGGSSLHVKRIESPGLWQNFKDLFQKPRGRRAWHAANALAVRGIPTPKPLALVEETFLGLVRRSWLVTERLEQAPTLAQYVHDRFVMRGPDHAAAGALLRGLAGALAALYREEIYHGDLKASNILVKTGEDGGPEFFFTDFDGIQLWRKPRAWRVVKNLVQLYCSLPLCVARPAAVRFFVRFLRETGLREELGHRLPEIARKARARLDRWIAVVRKYGKIL